MGASARLVGWLLAANAAGAATVMLLGAGPGATVHRILGWCGIG